MATLSRHDARGIIRIPSWHNDPTAAFAQEADVPDETPASPTPPSKPAQVGPSIDVEVRRARASDLLALPRFSKEYALNFPETPEAEIGSLRSVMMGVLPFSRDDHPTFIARTASDRRVLGAAHFRAVGPDQRWMATCIRTNPGVYDDEPIVIGLLHHAIQDAGFNGVKRLYAKAEIDSPVRGPLRTMGFTPYMTETIMAAPHVPVLSSGGSVRTLDQTDVWAIHQLYIHSTPRDVQYAEAFTSHNWDVGTVHRDRGHECRAWCIVRDFVAVAYARAISHRDAHVVDLMVAREWRSLLPDLLAEVFRQLSSMSSRRVYVSVRGYQRELIPLLEHYGFAAQTQQELSVRYTTASMRTSVISVESYAHEPAKEPATRRVPSFFRRQPPEEAEERRRRSARPSEPTHVSGHSE